MTETELLSVREAAEGLSVGYVTLYRWIKQGRVSVVRLPSGRMKVRRSEVDRLTGAEFDEPTVHPSVRAAAVLVVLTIRVQVSAPTERPQTVTEQEWAERERVAFHEATHAVAWLQAASRSLVYRRDFVRYARALVPALLEREILAGHLVRRILRDVDGILSGPCAGG